MNIKIQWALLFITVILPAINAQDYQLVWEDNFDGAALDSNIWNIETREGIWNTGGNSELQYYRKNNVAVGDDGAGNNCLILTAKEESYKGYGYTSGRVNTKSKFSFRYGKVEARIKVPNLANGLWPAFWTLGYEDKVWPDCGEIDILEMGHSAAISAGTPNKYVGSHLHWGPFPRDHGTEYTSADNLNEDYHLYKLEWTTTAIKVYLDNYLYFTMDITGDDAEEFRNYPHYLLFNLAVGGSLPGIYSSTGITAPLPANMYIDYVKIYQQTGVGDLVDTANVMFGDLGVYEEAAAVNVSMDEGFDATINTSGLSKREGEIPKEGDSVLSYAVTAENDFLMEIHSDVERNMVQYAGGSVQFWVKTENTDTLWVGIADKNGNEEYISYYEGSDNNPSRDGTWQIAYIQLSDIADKIDLQKMEGMLKIKGNYKSDGYLSIDRVIWTESPYQSLTTDYYGVYAEHDSIASKLDFGSGGIIHIWSGFNENSSIGSFYGENVLAYTANLGTWNGFGIHSDNPLDLSSYINGSLHFSCKTEDGEDIEIGFKNSEDAGWKYTYTGSSIISRDNQWHSYALPLKDFISDLGEFTADDLKDIAILFYMVGTLDVAFDEIYISKDGTALAYPNKTMVNSNYLESNIFIWPNPADDYVILNGVAPGTEVQIYDQLGKLIWKSDQLESGRIDLSGFINGFYFLKLTSANQVHTIELIIN